MNMKYIIAVDLGGTITKVGLLRNGELVDYVKMPSRQDLDMTASLPEIENAIDFLLNSNGVKRLFGVGIAFPGLVNNKKSIIISTNEKYDDGVELDLDRWADEHWGAPFYIDNDARLAAIGEWQYGSGRGYDSVVMMTIGTGIGSGVIMNGEVWKALSSRFVGWPFCSRLQRKVMLLWKQGVCGGFVLFILPS